MINYDTERGITVTKDGSTGSTLTLKSAAVTDSGNYTCSPYNIRAASVLVHVLSKGNSAAAVQNEQDLNKEPASSASNAVNNRDAPPSAAVHSLATKVSVASAASEVIITAVAVVLWSLRTT